MLKVFCILSMVSFLTSCNAIRQTKDRKALGRVLTNSELLDKAYKVGVGLHPTFPEIVYVKGKDSIIYRKSPYPVYIDTGKIKEDCPQLNIDSLILALRDTFYVRYVDTIKTEDTSLRRQYNILAAENMFDKGRLLAAEGQINDANKLASKRYSYMWYSWIGAAIIISLLVFMKKKK